MLKRILIIGITFVMLIQTACTKVNTPNDSVNKSNQGSENVAISSSSSRSSSDKSSVSANMTSSTVKSSSQTVSGKNSQIQNILNSLKSEDKDCPSYDLTKYTKPYWQGNVVYNESVMIVKNEDGSVSPAPLLYYADKILTVRDSKLSKEFKENVDWKLENGKLVILQDSTIPQMGYGGYYLTRKIPNVTQPRTGGGYIFFGEGNTFHIKQIAVTYIHTQKWSGPIPAYKGGQLAKTIDKLKNKKALNILFYGDSITTGANSSGPINVAPFAPSWCAMTVDALKVKYSDSQITSVNTAVGGTLSSWGVENAQTLAADKKPDLAIIAFGMNDGTFKIPASDFKDNINAIIAIVKKDNPNCEFIIIASMLPNPEAADQNGIQYTYWSSLKELEGNSVAMVNITELHAELLKHKRYYDMTGNNVNHPNDFLARLYTQALVSSLSQN